MSLKDSNGNHRRRQEVELTEFHYDILFQLAEGRDYGLGLKQKLQQYYGEEINHGKLYPNLDDLAAVGLIKKGKVDNRTNDYSVTEAGVETALERLAWAINRMVEDETEAKAIIQKLEGATLGG